MSYWVVVPAAGIGARFGAALPKQYLPLHGATVLEHALAPFLADARLRGLAVALAADDTRFRELPCAAHVAIRTTAGGATRAASVLAGLEALAASGAAGGDWVMVHDAARPCLSGAEIDALLAAVSPLPAADRQAGAVLALPVADTVKRAAPRGAALAGDRVAATVPRDGLWRALTPQVFRLGALREALLQALQAPGDAAPTDESAAMEAAGARPLLVPGSPYNLKVTLAEDLAFAAQVLAMRGKETR
jgi:2-C-methyl-D-erythritol 4-phosphate cytidylyltransferase